ncbi:MAG: gliding motility lipoprotein GldB [Flavobacteriaceae bacterium]|nr:gliding motility lipoprotein GldB [Flavobacteriaceae bacterium]MBT4113047.1 gliding motility lipoprotein GldB [Flavobacteriaceae bacterium]MBT4613962.1 gliding motility lipoprotein GldB [Flavobacteriaceae bacterium]MBT5246076.1 gliding motility lipoprotein GldB [Flavobacteriaceae bacterium]MBT5650657.1 gliding motility lipoprotein GldB [Flavobacteriaceae bacterium]
MKKYIFYIIFLLLLNSCNVNDNKIDNRYQLTIERFDKFFYESTPNDLFDLKKDYPFLFPEHYDNKVWINRLNDSVQKEIYSEVNLVFSNLDNEKKEIQSFYKNFTFYFPKYELPRVITLISDVEYENRVILADSLLLIGLDNYLGSDHSFYSLIPKYISDNLIPRMIISDIAEEYAYYVIPRSNFYTFLEKIIFYGKVLYFKDIMMPKLEDRYKIGYSKLSMDWAQENEHYVWTYFVEKELLFSSENKLITRFINNAPFSKFYLSIDNESPGMIGRFIGWEIVKSYMKNNNTSFIEMILMNPIDIYNKSKYKPQK